MWLVSEQERYQDHCHPRVTVDLPKAVHPTPPLPLCYVQDLTRWGERREEERRRKIYLIKIIQAVTKKISK